MPRVWLEYTLHRELAPLPGVTLGRSTIVPSFIAAADGKWTILRLRLQHDGTGTVYFGKIPRVRVEWFEPATATGEVRLHGSDLATSSGDWLALDPNGFVPVGSKRSLLTSETFGAARSELNWEAFLQRSEPPRDLSIAVTVRATVLVVSSSGEISEQEITVGPVVRNIGELMREAEKEGGEKRP